MTGQVLRDAWGVPHLRAAGLDELARLQGRVTAEDRAWQLSYGRWRAEGRTAEVLGAAGVPGDVFLRRARVADTARRCWESLDAATASWVQAYVDGVNAGLERGAARSPELRALQDVGVRAEPWDPWSPLAVFLGQHLLFGGLPAKIARSHLWACLGDELAEYFRLEGEAPGGSNAWLIAGSRTASGSALIAGDSHRTIEQPGVYQQIRLACPGVDVVGFALPGVPGVAHFAHAGAVAWAITNAMADYQDLYLEQVRREAGGLQVRGPEGWQDCPTVEEVIGVRGGEPVRVEIAETERGPLVLDPDPDHAWSLRTPTRVEADAGFAVMRRLLLARSTAEVVSALAGWVEPVNSYLVADRDGVRRHVVAGRVPLRATANRQGPVPAWERRYAWQGYADLVVEPIEEVMACANDRDSGGDLGHDYAPDHRVRRLRALLAERDGWRAGEMPAIHLDTWQGATTTLRRLLDDLHPETLTARQAVARDLLLAWDGRADADSGGAVLFAHWRSALVRWLVEQPALAALARPHPYGALFAAALRPAVRVGVAWERLVAADNPLGVDLRAGVLAGLDAAGADGVGGRWADRHQLAAVHPFQSAADLSVPVAVVGLAGDVGCVCATHSIPGITDTCSFGPVTRYVWDLADRTAGGWVVPQGASGCADSPHQFDQQPLWAAGRLLPIITEWSQLTPEESW